MPRSDSKIVHAAALEAKRLCKQIIETDDGLQALLSGWDNAAWTRLMAAAEAPTSASPIKPTFKTKMLAVIDRHDTLREAIVAEASELEEVE